MTVKLSAVQTTHLFAAAVESGTAVITNSELIAALNTMATGLESQCLQARELLGRFLDILDPTQALLFFGHENVAQGLLSHVQSRGIQLHWQGESWVAYQTRERPIDPAPTVLQAA